MEMIVFETLIKLTNLNHLNNKPIKQFEKHVVNSFMKEIIEFLSNHKLNINRNPKKQCNEPLIISSLPNYVKKNQKLKSLIKFHEEKKLEKKDSLRLLIQQKIKDKHKKDQENPTITSQLEARYGFKMNFEKKKNEKSFIQYIPELKLIEKNKHSANEESQFLDVNEMICKVEGKEPKPNSKI